MANHKSAAKRARQAVKRQARNTTAKSAVKTYEKALLKGIDAKSKDVAELLKAYTSKIAKAAQKGIINKQAASRKISRLSKKVSKTIASATK